MQGENARVRWGLLDHALLEVTIRFEKSNYTRRIYKDWVLTQPEFIDQGSCIIKQTLMDHSHIWKLPESERETMRNCNSNIELEKIVAVTDINEGITHSHVLNIIIQRIANLQARVQRQVSNKARTNMEETQHRIRDGMDQLDMEQDEEIRAEIEAQVQDERIRISQESEILQHRNMQRIENYYKDKQGRNVAESFYVTSKLRGRAFKLEDENGDSVSNSAEINEKLMEDYLAKVGQEYSNTMSFSNFLDKYQVQLDPISQDTGEQKRD